MKTIQLLIAVLLSATILLGACAWELGFFRPVGAAKVFVVEKGDNFAHVAYRLENEKIITSARFLRWYIRIFGAHKKLQRGEFAVTEQMPIPAVVYALTEGLPIEYKFTVSEGLNLFQVADLLEQQGLSKAKDFLASARDPEVIALLPTLEKGGLAPKSIEGYVYPDTYTLQKVFSSKEIAAAMVQRFRDEYKKVKPEIEASTVLKTYKLSPAQLITLASIIEKETGAAVERPMIASVFLNRLQKRMRLQTDPTVIYGMWDRDGSFDGKIHKSDLLNPTDYNTYVIYGLPPGPIANPGMSAVRAVLQPATTDYLYFVSRNNGTHVFSKTYSEHQHAVTQTQIDPNARAGKSWRDLPKEQQAR